jgi:hypothetical protein
MMPLNMLKSDTKVSATAVASAYLSFSNKCHWFLPKVSKCMNKMLDLLNPQSAEDLKRRPSPCHNVEFTSVKECSQRPEREEHENKRSRESVARRERHRVTHYTLVQGYTLFSIANTNHQVCSMVIVKGNLSDSVLGNIDAAVNL